MNRRARGDEPILLECLLINSSCAKLSPSQPYLFVLHCIALLLNRLFPAQAGMNRQRGWARPGRPAVPAVPRARGDEPYLPAFEEAIGTFTVLPCYSIRCSPRTRG
eukprot:TRINITY_DN1778_c0_g1_i1.p1 TRINITY_DN1778_c0_g1~~TRINITY_DN1778_c0_g1_i1.p1  ORF type:complete len:106 (-),score=3.15 TRINITY_DN1778_c0_g1_i1:120-437(-)